VSSAPARFTVEVDPNSPASALTWTDIKVPNSQWGNMTVRVFDESGAGVGSEVLSTAPGESTVLLFDSSSGSKRYDVYFGAADWPPLPLKDDHAGILLETRPGDGQEIDQLPALLTAFDRALPVEGRAIVPGIFEGGNRFGPQASALLHFRGYFTAPAAEHLDFALISTDSSFLQVDGKEVVEWPGAHDWHGGMHGEHTGGTDVGAGIHQVDYYNDYFQPNGPPLLACLVVKGGPFANWTMLTPANTFFSPTAHAHVVAYAVQGTGAPPLALDWTVQEQSVIEHDNADVGFIRLTLSCWPPQNGPVQWTFDDGTTTTGPQVDHLFLRPGLRTVQVSGAAGAVRQIIRVHPDWHQLSTSPPELAPDAQSEILSRDPNTFSPSDLASCTAVFGTYKTLDALIKLQPAICSKMKDMTDADLSYLKMAISALAPDLAHATASKALLQTLLDRCSSVPALSPLGNWTRLRLAELTLATTDRLDDVKSLLAAVTPTSLVGDDHRRFNILQADYLLATGKVAEARQRYQNLTGDPIGPDARSGVRTIGQIGRARTFLDRQDDQSAADTLREVAWQQPIEKMSPEWALTELRLYQEENLPGVALLDATRLLPVITGDGRSDLLYRLTELAAQQGDHELASRTLAELLQKHAYSEEAARAKAKWPNGV
jgi:hypothetical protein